MKEFMSRISGVAKIDLLSFYYYYSNSLCTTLEPSIGNSDGEFNHTEWYERLFFFNANGRCCRLLR